MYRKAFHHAEADSRDSKRPFYSLFQHQQLLVSFDHPVQARLFLKLKSCVHEHRRGVGSQLDNARQVWRTTTTASDFPSVVKPWRRACLRRQNGPTVLVASSSRSNQNWNSFPGSVVLIKAQFIFTSPTFARMD
jgi:hypothetical protein